MAAPIDEFDLEPATRHDVKLMATDVKLDMIRWLAFSLAANFYLTAILVVAMIGAALRH